MLNRWSEKEKFSNAYNDESLAISTNIIPEGLVIEEKIGQGAYAIVYKGNDTQQPGSHLK